MASPVVRFSGGPISGQQAPLPLGAGPMYRICTFNRGEHRDAVYKEDDADPGVYVFAGYEAHPKPPA